MVYDYKEGKLRIKDILNNKVEIVDKTYVPTEENFTFDNSYNLWITSIFVDIRNSTQLFNNENKVIVSKIIRSFTSEIIEILRDYPLCEEIGIRGDCVYGVYSSPGVENIVDIAEKTYYINTLFKMLNNLYKGKGYPTISAGIGISTAKELVIKAGRKGVSINSKVWIGDAVTKASKLSSLGNKNLINPIVFSNCTYINIIESLKKEDKNAESWFSKKYDNSFGTYYHANIIKTEFNNWIDRGMPS